MSLIVEIESPSPKILFQIEVDRVIEQTCTKNALYRLVVLEKIFKYCQHSYVQLSPLGNGRGPAFEKKT